MNDLRKAAQQALEALDKATRFMSDSDYKKLNQAIDDLRAALAEPEQEPVAVVKYMETGGNAGIATRIVEIEDPLRERLRVGTLLYTAPTPRKPLTEGEMPTLFVGGLALNSKATTEIVRAVEKAHGIGEQHA